jgi:hypothetical protein
MAEIIDFTTKAKEANSSPEELACGTCGCDTFRLDTVGFYCVACYNYCALVDDQPDGQEG